MPAEQDLRDAALKYEKLRRMHNAAATDAEREALMPRIHAAAAARAKIANELEPLGPDLTVTSARRDLQERLVVSTRALADDDPELSSVEV